MTTQIGPENKFKFNGKELDDDFGLQHYDFHARAYNPQLGRMNGVDPLAKFELTPTHFCSNNPFNRIDPTGMSDFTTEENKLGGGPPDWMKNILSPHMSNGFKVFNLPGGGFKEAKDETPAEKESRIAGGNLEALGSSSHEGGPGANGQDGPPPGGGSCPNCLDPSTVGHNLFGLSYPGANNPKSKNLQDNFSYAPSNLAEYPAIGHDRRYSNLKISGASGLFTDTRTIGADWRFVGEELSIAGNPCFNAIDRVSAGVLGVGLGLSALPKTLFQLNTPFGYTQILMWYNISNKGVNDIPTIHKH